MNQSFTFFIMHLLHLTSVWWQRITEEEPSGHSRATVVEEEEAYGHGRVAAVEEEACARGRATKAVEEAGSSGVDGGGGDRRSRERTTDKK
jgi:hypothetical protein